MLYTVVPLERIYSNRTESLLINTHEKEDKKEDTAVEFKDITLKHGKISARREGENYIVEGINSTDMRDYLKKEYSPGSVITPD
ncbi:YlzJ-like family protein [Anaerocolumna sp. MB42-C2]|uniref:YlzJ-like family protein n=1 Tax=Anaerocolumna sp. MB42-C2 TaxID=3070997 RepID=UPI0027E05FF0|nr:YlzJ-like family protein [Anaerocolumna sp. MB42-C2]WMJ88344.1 YlzJ-like family protein [Anaerocolumna sp. MB42-C2]